MTKRDDDEEQAETEGGDELDQQDVLRRHVELGPLRRGLSACGRLREALEAQGDRGGDDLPHPEDADETRDRDGADADGFDKGAEDPGGVHLGDGVGGPRIVEGAHLAAEDIDRRHHHQHGQDRTRRDDRRIADPDDVAESEERRNGRQLDLDPEIRADPAEQHRTRQLGVPEVKRLDAEIKERTHREGDQQDLAGASGRALAGDQDVVDRRGLGEGQLAVEVLHEVLAQRNDQHDPERTTDEAGEEDLPPGDRHLVDVHGGHHEGRPGGHHPGRLTHRLDHDVLEDGAADGLELTEEDRQDGDGDRDLDGVAGAQRHVGPGDGEEHHHAEPDSDGPGSDLGSQIVGRDDGLVDLTRFEFAVGVGGQQLRVDRLRFLHHSSIKDCGK